MDYKINNIIIEKEPDGKIITNIKIQIEGTEREYFDELYLNPNKIEEDDAIKLALKAMTEARVGKWEKIGKTNIAYKCKNCQHIQIKDTRFCPECGALNNY